MNENEDMGFNAVGFSKHLKLLICSRLIRTGWLSTILFCIVEPESACNQV